MSSFTVGKVGGNIYIVAVAPPASLDAAKMFLLARTVGVRTGVSGGGWPT